MKKIIKKSHGYTISKDGRGIYYIDSCAEGSADLRCELDITGICYILHEENVNFMKMKCYDLGKLDKFITRTRVEFPLTP